MVVQIKIIFIIFYIKREIHSSLVPSSDSKSGRSSALSSDTKSGRSRVYIVFSKILTALSERQGGYGLGSGKSVFSDPFWWLAQIISCR